MHKHRPCYGKHAYMETPLSAPQVSQPGGKAKPTGKAKHLLPKPWRHGYSNDKIARRTMRRQYLTRRSI